MVRRQLAERIANLSQPAYGMVEDDDVAVIHFT
jgi:hypothetical protein